jgi:16S rRNA (adenine1518-N6/adenine1519-N6)-dimethyltransferase
MRKKFGQNFLVNPEARSRLLDALELSPGNEVWEVGPGLGAMTKGLLDREALVTAFEIDPAFAGILRELFAPDPRFKLVEGDVLKTWPAINAAGSACSIGENERFLLGNLPYNIAAALLADFIEKRRFFRRIVITVQREVALRMAAGPGAADYSSFSVLCSSAYKVSLLHKIGASSFYPAPRVDSQGVRMDLLDNHENLPKLFYPLVRGLFSSRRKIIRNTLSAFAVSVIIKENAAEEALFRAGVSGERRAETLGIEEFAALAKALEDITADGR